MSHDEEGERKRNGEDVKTISSREAMFSHISCPFLYLDVLLLTKLWWRVFKKEAARTIVSARTEGADRRKGTLECDNTQPRLCLFFFQFNVQSTLQPVANVH